jgi:divalent metal cation (Fe/Co/Zn/Cd) transporter
LVASDENVKCIDRIHAREHDHYILVEVRVSIPVEFTIQEGHDISRGIKESIIKKHNDVGEFLIHLNLYYTVDIQNIPSIL